MNPAIPRLATGRQLQALEIVSGWIVKYGYPPTLREVGRIMGIRSTNGVNDHMRSLVRKGYLVMHPMVSRGLQITAYGQTQLRQRGAQPSILGVPVNTGARCLICNFQTFDCTKPCVGCALAAETLRPVARALASGRERVA